VEAEDIVLLINCTSTKNIVWYWHISHQPWPFSG